MFKKVQQMISEIPKKTWRKEPYANLPDPHEKIERSYERINHASPILFEDSDAQITVPGTLYNYSRGGMYLMAETSPQRGSGAQIHMVNYSPDAPGPENLKKYYVQVRWVDRVPGATDSNLYSIGVKYCNDIMEFFKLFGH